MCLERLKWRLLFCKISSDNAAAWRIIVTSSGSFAILTQNYTMARVQHLRDEEHAMRVTCYLTWGLAIAVSVGLVVYAFLL